MGRHRRVVSLRLAMFVGVASIVALCLLMHHTQPANAELVGLLYLLPAMLLALVLFMGHYPGERALRRLCSHERSSLTRRCQSIGGPRRSPVRILRGGRLIAVCLAGRGPPSATVCC